MLSIKLLSNVELFSLLFSFFGPLSHPSFLSAFQGLHCLLAFENELLYVILWHMFSYLFLFLCQHAQSLSAPVCCGIVEPMNLQDSQSSLLSFSLMTVRFFCMEVCSMVKSCHLTEWSFATFMAFYYSLLPTRKEQISGCLP